MCLLVGVGCKYIIAKHDIRLIQIFRRLKVFSINANGVIQLGRGKMRCKGIGQPKHGGDLSTIKARAQDPNGDKIGRASCRERVYREEVNATVKKKKERGQKEQQYDDTNK